MTELKAIAENDNWSEVYSLADTYRQQQRWQQAAIAFQQAIKLRSDYFWSYHHLGDVLSQLKQWKQAAIAYHRAVQLDSNFFWSWHNLGNALIKLQQWKPAAMAYHRAVQLDSNFFWSWHNLGDALTKLQQWDRAIATYLQAILLQPEHQLVYQKLGTVFKQRGSLEDSIRVYRQLILNPQDSIYRHLQANSQLLIRIANSLTTKHQTIGAIVFYYMALEIQPNQTPVLQQLAQLLHQQNRLEQKIANQQQKIESELLTRAIIKTDPKPILGEIVIKTNNSVSPNQLEELCSAVGWSPRPLEKVQQSLDNSFSYVSAWHIYKEEKQLVGFARAICDGAFHAVLLDILIHPHFQNRGIGKTIVQTLIKQLHDLQIKDITLFASPHIVDFYHKLGFSQPNNLQWMLWCGDN